MLTLRVEFVGFFGTVHPPSKTLENSALLAGELALFELVGFCTRPPLVLTRSSPRGRSKSGLSTA